MARPEGITWERAVSWCPPDIQSLIKGGIDSTLLQKSTEGFSIEEHVRHFAKIVRPLGVAKSVVLAIPKPGMAGEPMIITEVEKELSEAALDPLYSAAGELMTAARLNLDAAGLARVDACFVPRKSWAYNENLLREEGYNLIVVSE